MPAVLSRSPQTTFNRKMNFNMWHKTHPEKILRVTNMKKCWLYVNINYTFYECLLFCSVVCWLYLDHDCHLTSFLSHLRHQRENVSSTNISCIYCLSEMCYSFNLMTMCKILFRWRSTQYLNLVYIYDTKIRIHSPIIIIDLENK